MAPPGYAPPPRQVSPPAPLPASEPPRDPLLDDGFRYRQVLGAYRPGDPRAVAGTGRGPGEGPRTSYVRAADRSRYRHDGFYFRFAGGLGSGHDSMSSSAPLPSSGQFPFAATALEGSGSAVAGFTELALGFTPGPGLVIGVASCTATIPRLSIDVPDPNVGGYAFRVSQLAVIGPVADFYVNPEAGFHIQGSPGVATYVAGAGDARNTGPLAQAHTAVGFGFMLGVGYEWWVASEWSVGFLGRFMYGTTSGKDPGDANVRWTHHSYAPAVLLSITYH